MFLLKRIYLSYDIFLHKIIHFKRFTLNMYAIGKFFIYYKVCLGNWLIYKLIHLHIIFWETYQFWWCMLIVFIMFVYLQTERTISRVNLCYMTSYAIARSKVSGYYWWNMYVYTKAWEWTCKNFWYYFNTKYLFFVIT